MCLYLQHFLILQTQGRQSLLPQRTGRPFRLLNSEIQTKDVNATIFNSPFRDRVDNTKHVRSYIQTIRCHPDLFPTFYPKSRPSMAHMVQHLASGIQGKDPRPIRDRTWQSDTIKLITNFIVSLGYNDSLVLSKTLQPPSTKEFQSIFKFIYYQIDPVFTFTKRFEDEFITILKNLRFVYARLPLC